MASVCHALGRGAVRCRAVAGGVRWGGRGVCASGVGARPCRGPALQGFSRWASGCTLLLRGWRAGGAESLRAAWWGASTIVEAARAGAGGGVEGAGVQRMQRPDVCSAMCWWALLSTGGVYRRLRASWVKAVRSQAVQLSFRAAPLLRRRTSRRSMGVACGRRGELTCWSDCLQCVCACVCVCVVACM